jgi:hypothetical protein
MGLLWLVLGTALLVRPRPMPAASKRFEENKTLIPVPPLLGVPVWAVRIFGIIVIGGAVLFFYLFLVR